MIIQTDADGTMYEGNLLVSLGWRYLIFLLRKRKYFSFVGKAIKLAFFYFLSHVPHYIHTAFFPFRGCPIELIHEVKKPLRRKWLEAIEKIWPEKIIVISRQEKNLLEAFIGNKQELKKYKFEIKSNIALIKDGKFTGKIEIIISPYRKHGYIDDDLIYLGDLRDYFLWGRKKNNFILV
jgi:glycosyltransferase involved in cell wall biosynthesis